MAEATIPILDMKNIGKVYSQNGRAIEALRGANLTVKKGEFICLIGASGCGKSTLLRMAAGFEAATHGDVLMWGMPITGPGQAAAWCFRITDCFPGSMFATTSALVRNRGDVAKPKSGRHRIVSSSSSGCSASPMFTRTSFPAA